MPNPSCQLSQRSKNLQTKLSVGGNDFVSTTSDVQPTLKNVNMKTGVTLSLLVDSRTAQLK